MKVSDTIAGVKYTVYEDGLLLVGTDSNRTTVRLKVGADVEAEVRKVAGLPTADVQPSEQEPGVRPQQSSTPS